MLSIENLHRHFVVGNQTVQALAGVNLTVANAEFVAVMGPSGSGKSTLLNVLGLLDRPTSGRYELAGRDVSLLNDDAQSAARNGQIGFVFQSFHLLARLSVLENTLLPLRYSALEREQVEPRARELLSRMGLADRLGHKPGELSGGQQQRVAICRALVQEPDIILADEPVASLDPRNSKIVMDALQRINRHYGLTVLVNLHSLDIAREYCDRLVGMADGRVVFDDGPAALTDDVARALYGMEAGDVMAADDAPAMPEALAAAA